MSDSGSFAVVNISDLGHGIHDLLALDTADFRSFAVRLDPYETRPPVARSDETFLLVVEGSITVVWSDATHAPTKLGEGEVAFTNPPAVQMLSAGPDGAAFLALIHSD